MLFRSKKPTTYTYGPHHDPLHDTPAMSKEASADFKRIMKKHGVKNSDDAEHNKHFQKEILTKHAKKFGGTYQVMNHFGGTDHWERDPTWHLK